MTSARLYRVRLPDGAVLGAAAFGTPVSAADMAVKSPAMNAAVYNWTGFYVGGHVGYGDGSLGPDTNPLPLQGVFFPHTVTGGIGGFHVGYNHQFANRFVLGVEADATFVGPIDLPRRRLGPFNSSIDYVGTVRGRAGYSFGTWMRYITGGYAWGHSQVRVNDAAGNVISEPGQYQTGWTVGAGAEFALSGNWTAKLEYDYVDLSRRTLGLNDFGMPGVSIEPRLQMLKFGLNYQLGDSPWSATPTRSVLPDSSDWSVHGQTSQPTTYRAPGSTVALVSTLGTATVRSTGGGGGGDGGGGAGGPDGSRLTTGVSGEASALAAGGSLRALFGCTTEIFSSATAPSSGGQ